VQRPDVPTSRPDDGAAPRHRRRGTWRGAAVLFTVTAGLVAAGLTAVAGPASRSDAAAVSASASSQAAAGGSMTGHPTPGPQDPEALGPSTLATAVTPLVVTGEQARRGFHEFQADCTITRHAADDPIVFPGLPGASHQHTFFGNRTTSAGSTVASLAGGAGSAGTSCRAPGDGSAYWMPTMYAGSTVLDPKEVVVYYKSGVDDYRTVRPFPKGFRMIVGSPRYTSAAQFTGYWSCGNSGRRADFVTDCSRTSGDRMAVRLTSPSCWDGVHLDSADHVSHVAYPVKGACPADHPVAVPMLEFKVLYPIQGTTGAYSFASGGSWTFHYDFVNLWDDATLAALVRHCVNGGLQCDARGYDQHHAELGAVLDQAYRLPRAA